MHFGWRYLFVLIWLAYLIASGVYLFSRGFLLSRVSKTDVSTCRQLSTNPDDNYYLSEELVQEIFKDVNASANLCLPQKSKVIILLIDALKYEFGVYNESNSSPLHYENQLKVLHELLVTQPEHTRLMRFKADPPTTTLQRLKGLTTGSLPTFIDIGSNFASPEINEDNIIDQMVKTDLPIVFMGDSTWTELYPRRFKRAYAYPSFDIFDLDTVDNQIKKHLPNELVRADWQVLIAHFLGVDHCGHKHGPMHEEMTRKLSEMNQVINDVIAGMDNETTLLVMGDHGMTASGDHGGDSADETNALLFAYSKKHKFISSDLSRSDKETLQQIDLVPTLAAILGVPIPYSNLGLINFNIVPDVPVPHMQKFQALLLHAWQNAQQIYNYFYNYALENTRTFNVEQMDKLETEFILLTYRVKSIYNEAGFKSFVADLNAHLRQILDSCRDIWIKFDADQMLHGLLFTFLPIFFSFLLVNNSKPLEFYALFTSKRVAYTYLLNIAAAVFGYRYFQYFNFKTAVHGVSFCTNVLSAGCLLFYTARNWSNIAINWSEVKRFAQLPTRLVLLLVMSVFFSNSFIIQEPKVLSFLLIAVIILLAFELLQLSMRLDFRLKFKMQQFLKSITLKVLLAVSLAIIFIRCCDALFRCREELGNCVDFNNNGATFSLKTAANNKVYLLAVVILVLYTILTRHYLKACGNLTGHSLNVLLTRYGPIIAAICASGHLLVAHNKNKHIKRAHIDAMALIIYALFVLQMLVLLFQPLMAYVMPPKRDVITVQQQQNIIPEIFKRMKRMYDGDEKDARYKIPVVYGLTTIYSSVLIAFSVFLAMLLIVLLEPRASIGMVLCIFVGAILLVLHAVLRYRTAKNFDTIVQPTFTAIVAWFLLAHFCFFATSHQTTLSQIDWRAAFVGRSNSLGQSHLISGLLVILNTFCGQIFFFSLYGLLSTQTFSIFALFPKLVQNLQVREPTQRLPAFLSNQQQSAQQRSIADISAQSVGFDITRGELTPYENEALFLGSLFRLGTQFLMLQGLKVFCSMLACTIHCRHLMVWKIFAPRFIYEALATFVSFTAIIIGYLLYLRIHSAINGLIRRLNRIKLD